MATAGIGVVAALSLAVSGCAGTAETDSGSPDSSAEAGVADDRGDAKEALAAAAAKNAEESARVNMSLGTEADGVLMEVVGDLDPANETSNIEITMGGDGEVIEIVLRQLGTDVYMQFGGSDMAELADVWMKGDSSKLPENAAFSMMPTGDPADMVGSIAEAQWSSDTEITGTIDMTKSPEADAELLAEMGEAAKAVPFTATLDAQDRLVEMVIDAESVSSEAGLITIGYSNFGEPVSVEVPTGEVIDMSDDMLDMFNT
ncbi:hypothetical protein [Micromonospora sp. NBC_01813]|uniref:hypothetical protein n=1 Tax=Micromonospora sp. NBC_01813 TaxID=2975988 RepID=UPI002DD8C18E|nr:hypothetical protein [Micromonospora sp. NBC_01813]WSA12194.1 hypothetical protein OG958_16250 [Micromonospora sp. NBC_01813]